ncbi:hypothetical protein SprV_0200909100 [Sparganum proliferum]
MLKFGCLERFIHAIRQPHDGTMVQVTENGPVSEAFVVTNGEEDGVLAPSTLFSPVLTAMLMEAYHHEERPGINIV